MKVEGETVVVDVLLRTVGSPTHVARPGARSTGCT